MNVINRVPDDQTGPERASGLRLLIGPLVFHYSPHRCPVFSWGLAGDLCFTAGRQRSGTREKLPESFYSKALKRAFPGVQKSQPKTA